jgi:hypothetical protein
MEKAKSLMNITHYEIELFLQEKELNVEIIFGWLFMETIYINKNFTYEDLFDSIIENSILSSRINENKMYWIYRYDYRNNIYIPVEAEKK